MKTVFIVGAGASLDFGFPLGTQLVTRIREMISNELQTGSDGTLRDAATRGGYIDDFDTAAREIAAGMVVSRSIDRFLHSRRGNDAITKIGKNAISLAISRYEAGSYLEFDEGDWDKTQNALLEARNSWLGKLFAMLQEGYSPNDAEKVFEDFSFITFNYDRTIERYLRLAFSHTLGQTYAEASRITSGIPIHHVYGSLGEVDGASGKGGLSFGPSYGEIQVNLDDMSHRIRTFTESRDEDAIQRCHQEIRSSDLIVFLGFGFDALNLEALFPEPLASSQTFSGTMLGVGPKEQEDIARFLGGNIPNRLIGTDCPNYIDEPMFKELIGR